MNITRILSLAAILTLTPLTDLSANTIRMHFEGSFGNFCGSCSGSGLEVLTGTTFTADFYFPDQGIDFYPADPEIGLYSFAPGAAFFHFDSTVDEFDRSLAADVRVLIANCVDGGVCYYGTDGIFVAVGVDNFRFDLGGPLGPHNADLFQEDAIPPVSFIQQVLGSASGFGVSTADYAATIDTYTVEPPGPLTVTVSTVPLPAAVWLLGSALGVLGVMRRRASG